MRRADLAALAAVLALGAVLRVAGLGDVPQGFHFDEASVALNARCIVETGRDQYAEPWPFYFRALDDYKDPIFVYGVAAWSLVAGDDVRAARGFAALCGVLSLVGAWLLAREVLGPGRGPLLAVGLLTVSPWHLQYSRIAWQAITLVLAHTLAAWLLLRALRLARAGAPATTALALGGALLGLTLWTYSPAKLWVPLLGAAFVALAVVDPGGRPRRWPWSARATAAGLLAFLLAATPFVVAYVGHRHAIDLRFEALSVFAPGGGGWPQVLRGWAAGLSPDFLFVTGDPNPRHSPPLVGQMLLAEAPLLVVGLLALWRDRTPAARLVVAWVLLAPLLAAFTRDPPHATRTIAMLPALQLATARGALALVRAAGPRRRQAALALGLALGACAGHATWAHFTAPARTDRERWRPAVAQVVETARALMAREGAARVHFLPDAGPLVTSVDWVYLLRVPAVDLQAHASTTRRDPDRYDPWDQAGRLELFGADFHYDGGPVQLRPGELLVQGPGDRAPPGLSLLHEDGAARYWRVP